MTIEQMKNTSFPKASYENWKEEAVRTLKGKPYEQLLTTTFEGIDLQPLYTAEHLEKTLNHSKVVSQSKQEAKWLIAQSVQVSSASEFLHKTNDQLNRGNDMLVYAGTTTPWKWTPEELKELAELLKKYSFYLSIQKSDDSILQVFDVLSKSEIDALNGFVSGNLDHSLTSVLSTKKVHYAGGSAVHELTYALWSLAKQAEKQSDFANKVAVQFAIDTNFFMEIAKLRAFRVLWKAFSTAYGQTAASIPVMAETTLRSYSKLDQTVNLLRAGNAAFSAVLGGADILTVHPHDVLTGGSVSSERIARNVQLVIREETMVNKIIDPSAGSYYVETLTADLVRQSWDLFLQVVEMNSEDQEDYLLSLANTVQSLRVKALAKRKTSLIGTNIYANPADSVTNTASIEEVERLAVPFEKLREHFIENPLKTAVVSFGVLKEVKPRADFIQGFLQAGGLNPEMSPVFTAAQDAWHWVKSNHVEYVVVAAKDELTKDIMPNFLAQADQQTIVDVAGKHAEENMWSEQGLNGAIYAGQDLIAKMDQLIDVKKGGSPT